MKPWPEPGPKGQALTRAEAAELLGRSAGAIVQAERRTEAGTALIAFPPPADYAIPEGARQQPVPFWWFDDVAAYGQAAGMIGSAADGYPLTGPVRGRNQYVTRRGPAGG